MVEFLALGPDSSCLPMQILEGSGGDPGSCVSAIHVQIRIEFPAPKVSLAQPGPAQPWSLWAFGE